MDNTLTLQANEFALNYSDESGSKRTCPAGDLFSTGDAVLTIAHQPYVDTATKAAGIRSVMRLTATLYSAETGKPATAFAQLTIGRPVDVTVIDNTKVLTLIKCIKQMIGDASQDTGELDLASDFVANKAQ